MPMERFIVGPLSDGLNTSVKPWLLQDSAFSELVNAYYYRGRIRKRFGTLNMIPLNGVTPGFNQLPSRLGVVVGVTIAGALSGTVPGTTAAFHFFAGQSFSVTYISTVTLDRTTVMFTVISNTPGPQQMLRTDGLAAAATYDVSNGNFNITGIVGDPGGSTVIFYPSLPVMGIKQWNEPLITTDHTYAFDTQFAYEWTADGWQRIGTATTGPNAGIWTGTDINFFWTATYRGATQNVNLFFVTNDFAPDRMQYWDGTNWTVFTPAFNGAGGLVQTCLMIIPFKDRLLLLNTTEFDGANQVFYPNRMRYSVNGNILGATAFYDAPNVNGFGGYVDNLQTQESIVGAQFIKDRLIVSFENSTWEIVYTGNEIQPFRWQQINTELGADATFSPVPFDKVVLTVGNVGIHACNGANVTRIDQKIPLDVFQINDSALGFKRTYGIRDFYAEQVYWTLNAVDEDDGISNTYPNRILVYNYLDGTWAYNTDSFTCFGYFQQSIPFTWENSFSTWAQSAGTWGSGDLQGQFPAILAGNQEGFISYVNVDCTRNAPSLQITNLTYSSGLITITAINHNINTIDTSVDQPEYIIIENVLGITGVNGVIFTLNSVINEDSFTLIDPGISGTYLGGGTIARVSNINVMSKQFNPYLDKGLNCTIPKIEFQVDKTVSGQLTCDYFTSTSLLSTLNESQVNNVILGTNVLDTSPYPLLPLEQTQVRLFHPIYFQSSGEFIQFRLYMDQTQMTNSSVAFSDFQLHSFTIFALPSGRLQ